MRRLAVTAVAIVAALSCSADLRADVVIGTVTVGNPGNADDTWGDGYGGVDYVYNIGTFEVTAGQYTEFLNAVAVTDTYELWSPGMWDTDGCHIWRSGSSGSYTYFFDACNGWVLVWGSWSATWQYALSN